jgi:hypothetical protein
LADLREYEAICEATAGAVAVALAPKGERGVSHSLPPNFGEYEFTLVAKNRRLSYRAISSVGGNMLFQGALAAPEFELDDVVAIEITPGPKSGLAAATLIVE